jgi:hypothetical protein
MNTPPRIGPKAVGLTVAVLFTATLVVGCGGDPAKNNVVSGKVSVDGKPAKGIALTLHYSEGSPVSIAVEGDGSFNKKGVRLGKATVTFTASTIPPLVASRLEEMKNKGAGQDTTDRAWKQRFPGTSGGPPIPAKYASPKTSPLTWEITAGTNEQNFDLKE